MKLYTKSFSNHNVISASVATNSDEDLDKNDTKTYISLRDQACTQMYIKTNGEGDFKQINHVELLMIGNSENECLIDSLKFFLSKLEDNEPDGFETIHHF